MSTAVISFTFQILEQHRISFYEQMDKFRASVVQNNNHLTDSQAYDDQKLFESFFVERFQNDAKHTVHWDIVEFDMTDSGYYCKFNKFNIHRWGIVYFNGLNNEHECDNTHRNQLVVYLILNRIPFKYGQEQRFGFVSDESEIARLAELVHHLIDELSFEWTGKGRSDLKFLHESFSRSVDKKHESFTDAGLLPEMSLPACMDRCYADLLHRKKLAAADNVMVRFSSILRSACTSQVEPFYVIAGTGDYGHVIHARHLYMNCGQPYGYGFINYLQTLVVYKSITLASLFEFQNRLKRLSIKKLEQGREIQVIKDHYKLFRSNFFVYFKPLFLGRMYTNAWDQFDQHFDLRQAFVSIGEEIEYIDKERKGTEQDLLNRTVVQLTKKTILVAFITSIFSSFITLIVAYHEANFKNLVLVFLVMAALSVAVYAGLRGRIEKTGADFRHQPEGIRFGWQLWKAGIALFISVGMVSAGLMALKLSPKNALSSLNAYWSMKRDLFLDWIRYDIVYLSVACCLLSILILAGWSFLPARYQLGNGKQ